MSEISAADVRSLRDRTGLPMMDCKKALAACNGDAEAAVRWLRERGVTIQAGKTDRTTDFGTFGLYFDGNVGAMVELKCESAPVAGNEEFLALACDLARQLALGPGAETAEGLLAQPSPGKPGMTLGEQKDELFNRIREVFVVGRMVRYDQACGGYVHPGSRVHGVLLAASGGEAATLKDICMHIAAMSPAALTAADLPAEEVDHERAILREAAIKEGKPANIVEKMIEGRLRNYYAQRVLTEQPFVRDDSTTVGEFAKKNGIALAGFTHWVIGD